MVIFQSDRPLLDAFRRGETTALERVYLHYVDRVFELVRLGFMLDEGKRVPGVREPDRQQDLVHDIFLRAFKAKARDAFDGLRAYQPYLLRIAKNLMIDRVRKKNPELALDVLSDNTSDAEALSLASAPETDPTEDLHWRTLSSTAQAWVATLDAEARAFIEHRFVHDLPQRDVAVAMGVTRRRVRTLEARVFAGLRAHLNARGIA